MRESDQRLDAALQGAVEMGIPGVVALATTRHGVFYQGAAGVRRLGEPEPMSPDTVLTLWSCAKAITAAAALQLYEQGRLDLDAPAEIYAPALADLKVLDGFAADGAPRFRPPKRHVTARRLLTHTAGFAYKFLNADFQRVCRARDATRHWLEDLPLMFDPGERWEYGHAFDVLGLTLEGATGKRLDELFAQNLFAPLGMSSTGFTLSPADEARRAAMHAFGPDGALVAKPVRPLARPAIFTGGGGLHGSAADFVRFLTMWLDGGGGLLEAETIAYAEQRHVAPIDLPRSVDRALTLDFEFFPGVAKSWALGFLRLEADAPTGRAAGSIAWAGLGNLFFWIDRRNDVAGFWAAQFLPFLHPWARAGFDAFERAVYQSLAF